MERSRHCLFVTYVLFLVLAWMLPNWAWGQARCTGGGFVHTFLFPQVSVPRDAPAGTFLTPWQEAPNRGSAYRCTTAGRWIHLSAVNEVEYGQFPGLSVPLPPGTSGAAPLIAKTNIPGVGLAVTAMPYTLGNPVSANLGKGWPNYAVLTIRNLSNHPIGMVLWVALVRTSDQMASAGVHPAGPLVRINLAASESDVGGVWASDVYRVGEIRVLPLACDAGDVAVSLPAVSFSDFDMVGAVAGTTEFSVRANNCAGDIQSIRYKIDPVTMAVDRQNGIFSFEPDGASGVAFQLRDAAGNPHPLGTFLPVVPTASGDVDIPLQVAYVRTDQVITPGGAHAAAWLTFEYQ